MRSDDLLLGYLLVTSPVPNVYIGGLMVIDNCGLPVEFRYTEPIQPTKIQQILYGSVLTRYIKTDVILETLLKSLDTNPTLLIVNDESFLTKSVKDFEMIRLTETKAPPLKSLGGCEKISAMEYLLQLTPETSPVRVQLAMGIPVMQPVGGPKSLPDKELDPENDFMASKVYTILLETGQRTDVLEPLTRVEKALATLCQEAGIKAAAS